jgi:signal peptidase I
VPAAGSEPPVAAVPRIVGPDPMVTGPEPVVFRLPVEADPALVSHQALVPDQVIVTDQAPVTDQALVTDPAPEPAADLAIIEPSSAPTDEIARLPPEAPPRTWSISFARFGEELLAWFKTLLSAAVYATLIVTFGFQVARVEGQSMVPTLEDQDRLIVNKLAYRLGEPRVGDIVMLYYPEDPSKSFVKRIVAEPGDTIKIVDGRVLRNDVPLADDFIPERYRDHDNLGPFVLPRGYYYVMGDHRNNSSDSRTWGYVPKKYIIGKVQLRWWPVNSAKVF